jgi:hypothetical protein
MHPCHDVDDVEYDEYEEYPADSAIVLPWVQHVLPTGRWVQKADEHEEEYSETSSLRNQWRSSISATNPTSFYVRLGN